MRSICPWRNKPSSIVTHSGAVLLFRRPPIRNQIQSRHLLLARENPRNDMEVHRAKKNSGYGRNWKKWLAIYAVVALMAYAIIYLVLSSNGGGGGGLY